MFPSRVNLFKNIECPGYKNGKCKLPHCIFTHKRPNESAGPSSSTKRARFDAPSAKINSKIPASCSGASKPSPALVPIVMNHPPAGHPERLQYVKIIKDKLEENGTDKTRSTQLTLDLELEEAQRSTLHTYKGNIRNLVRRITRGEYADGAAEARAKTQAKNRTTTMDKELVDLVIPLKELEKRYITSIPDGEPSKSDWFECDRCKQRVRFEDIAKDLNAGISRCKFHLLRRPWNPDTRKLEQVFPCCGATLEEQGCQDRNTHVYKLVEPSALHEKVPFVSTPPTQGLFAIGIDCEMAYTTKGMELIRVTAISWSENKIVYDRIVCPSGAVLDLNTRFSGVSDLEQGLELEGVHCDPLSFEEARKELFEIIGSNTILIGHGLENDLIAMRLIHHRIVDTAILYPRNKIRTHSLKQLAWMFLGRTIQTGEHDSFEDSLAAMDVIRKDIEDRCKLSGAISEPK